MKPEAAALSRAIISILIIGLIFLFIGIGINTFAGTDPLNRGKEIEQKLVRESQQRTREARAKIERSDH